MFGDPLSPTPKWERVPLGDCLDRSAYGPRFFNEQYSDEGVPIIRITDLNESGELNFQSMPKMAVTPGDLEKYAVKPGEILFARSGSVGKTAIFPQNGPQCIAGAYFIVLRMKPNLRPVFVRNLLNSIPIQELIISRSRQAAQPNFSGPGLRSIPLLMPPLEVQIAFEQKLETIEKTRASMRHSFENINALFNSIQDRSFKGEL